MQFGTKVGLDVVQDRRLVARVGNNLSKLLEIRCFMACSNELAFMDNESKFFHSQPLALPGQ